MPPRIAPEPPPEPSAAPTPGFDAAQIASVTAAVLGRAVDDALFVPKGFANENWRVRTRDGDVLVKIGKPGANASKWRASARAVGYARRAGVPGPVLLHSDPCCAALEGRVLRVQQWVDGLSPAALEPEVAARFWATLGRAVRSLHGIGFDAFSSRLDDSAPDFPTWSAYLGYRVPQIEARCARVPVLASAERAEIWEHVFAAARAVDDVVRPVFVHRDLHPDNLLATPDGELAGLLDFDMVEPWDPVGDWYKLAHWCFAGRPERRLAFEAGYGAPAEHIAAFETRRAIVDVIEGMNMAADEGLREHAAAFDWTLALVRGALEQRWP